MKHPMPEIGYHGGCGGRIKISDLRGSASREFRYEAWCTKCYECDCDGYSSVKATVEGASAWFSVKPTEAEAMEVKEVERYQIFR